MIKLIVCDLDGTLLDDNKKLDSNIFEVIPKLKEKGITFSIASGRNEELLKDYIDELNIEVPYVTNNGGNIYQKHKCIQNICIPQKYNNLIAKILYDNEIAFRIFSIENIYEYLETDFFDERMRNMPDTIKYHPDLDLSNNHIYKINSDFSKHLNKFDEIYNQITSHPDISYLKAEENIYCVNAIDASKGSGLERVCELLNIDINETMAIGDNGTDLTMLEKASVSVVVENAQDDIKMYADYICGDNNHNGVSKFLREYFNL